MEKIQKATAGNAGDKIRSDCQVTIERVNSGGIKIDVKSKVGTLYGSSIIELCKEVLLFLEIENARVEIEDSGALPFVIMARIEAAVRKITGTEKEFLPEFIGENKYPPKKEQFRFSRLYLPGNTPSMMLNAGLHNPNGIILDLEDSVAPDKKQEALLLVRNALRQVRFYGAERMVRINQYPAGLDDLKYIIPHNVHVLLVPKCEGKEHIIELEKAIEKLKKERAVKAPVFLMPIIESCMGVEKAFEIATASPNIVALAIGLEDYTADLGAKRTKEGTESFYARTRLVNACKASGIQAIDSVFSDVADMEGLHKNVKDSKALGFEGMGCIHPRQIKVIHEAFTPEPDELEKAKKIVIAFNEASVKGLSVVSLGSKMIDPPVVKRAQKTIDLAINLGMLSINWKEEEHVGKIS